MLSPTVDEIAEKNPDIFVGKINVDEENAIASAFGITSIPTLVVIKNGKITAQSVGLRPKDDILKLLDD